MHRVWNSLAKAAGEERVSRGLIEEDSEDRWTELQGTVLRESIAERRKFWFALVSRATNTKGAGSVSVLGWLWEQQGGLDRRKQKAYELQLQKVYEIPRINEATREKLIAKIKEEAAAEGMQLGEGAPAVPEPLPATPGVPNWEIEELKSISDGHILLRSPPEGSPHAWSWIVDPYKSLPRIGTDALHPALVSVDAHRLRLRMLQGRDRADMLRDTRGAAGTLDDGRLELTPVELILQQPAGAPLSIEEQVARLVLASSPSCNPLRAQGYSEKALNQLAARLLQSEPGQRASAEILAAGEVAEQTRADLFEEVGSWGVE